MNKQTDGIKYKIPRAAKMLGIDTSTLYRWIKELGFPVYKIKGEQALSFTLIERVRIARAEKPRAWKKTFKVNVVEPEQLDLAAQPPGKIELVRPEPAARSTVKCLMNAARKLYDLGDKDAATLVAMHAAEFI